MSNLDLFVKDYLNNSMFGKMAYLQGWQPDIENTNYDYLKAILSGAKPGIDWDSSGAAGAQWHWPSKTEGGQWLKDETHPTRWKEYNAELENLFNKIF